MPLVIANRQSKFQIQNQLHHAKSRHIAKRRIADVLLTNCYFKPFGKFSFTKSNEINGIKNLKAHYFFSQ
jgi:hypothetical protein